MGRVRIKGVVERASSMERRDVNIKAREEISLLCPLLLTLLSHSTPHLDFLDLEEEADSVCEANEQCHSTDE